MSKMLPQTDNECLKVDVKHVKWFWCAICDIHVNNRDDRDFTIGSWGEHKKNGGHKKALSNKIAIVELKNRSNTGEKRLNFGKKINTSPLTYLFSKKRKNCSGDTKTSYADGFANGLNAKTAFSTSPLPKQNVKTFKRIFL